MFSHIVVGSNDLDASKAFYDAVLGALGCPPAKIDYDAGRMLYVHDNGRFLVTKPLNGEEATGANGGTVGFAAKSPEEVEAWHKAGLANGGVTLENPPGPRDTVIGKLYLAYLRDPSGNKICALHAMG
ncbi:VOC family protein [Asaia astilbis]|uniref:VOC family protein n=1 Tax=Asaia astilbis TaxID=610244 RepID=UPI000470366B|nr:VOC family protein [Asaia astilbis]